jgi:cell division protease FtsH
MAASDAGPGRQDRLDRRADREVGRRVSEQADRGGDRRDDRPGLVGWVQERLGGRSGPDSPPPWRVEGANDQNQQGGRSTWSRMWWLLLVLLVVNWIISSALLSPASRVTVSYTFFVAQVQAKNVATITSTGEMIEGSFKQAASYTAPGKRAQQVTLFTTQRPAFATDNLFQQLQSTGVPVNANPPDQGPPFWEQLLLGFGPTLLLLWLLFSFSRRLGGGAAGALGGFGRSRARLYQPESGPRTTFADVAGIDEVEGEVSEIVEAIRSSATAMAT